ncbi:MAG: hypothetical protein OEW33_12690 [Nitrospirota bacterium]|jgi:hypothetical protein|nr:hypothetical protein [Nitrospirota bacterium]
MLLKLGTAIGAQFVFQSRFASFSQDFEDRWEVPGVNLRVVQTRQSTLGLSLQLWDTTSSEPMCNSVAEAHQQTEAVTQDPVFLEDAARLALGSMMADVLHRKTTAPYAALYRIIAQVMQEAVPDNSKGCKPEADQENAPGKRRKIEWAKLFKFSETCP